MKPFLEQWNPTVKAATVLVCVILLSVQYLVSLNLAVFGLCVALLLAGSRCGLRRLAALLLARRYGGAGAVFSWGCTTPRGGAADTARAGCGVGPALCGAGGPCPATCTPPCSWPRGCWPMRGWACCSPCPPAASFSSPACCTSAICRPRFAYGILAAFHLMPGMVREFRQVRLAFAVRGLHVHALSLKPIFTMLVNSVRWSESVAMAMESKGFCGDAPRSYYTVPRVARV